MGAFNSEVSLSGLTQLGYSQAFARPRAIAPSVSVVARILKPTILLGLQSGTGILCAGGVVWGCLKARAKAMKANVVPVSTKDFGWQFPFFLLTWTRRKRKTDATGTGRGPPLGLFKAGLLLLVPSCSDVVDWFCLHPTLD